ncbi:TetR/AcrR family transcriptional regulator C-terminal domain-containing protein [Rhizohabitans arisaemae]|uniref:TetR/AcrR family transcriptional regulator C-terminal domain-containing protein n=1 Tax=Rhizohabitans arisaemae TaxID=2720610 RepID=UPI0024B2047A|nr:TetR/AcrR family transcriptional regulator C-terminal domain-containing protein [Rhizohabitans arisaemae]
MTTDTTRTASGGRKRRSLNFLTPELMVETALRIVETEGADALTFRRLGAELQVDHTAVLRHFGNKDDLLLALTNRLLEESHRGFTPAAHWRDTIADLARRLRRACLAHPKVAALVATRTSRREAEFRGANWIVEALFQAGLRGREAASYYRALVDVGLAYSSFEATLATVGEEERRGDREAWQREYLLASPSLYPHLAEVAPHLAQVDEEDQFEITLGLLLDAVELRATQAKATNPDS